MPRRKEDSERPGLCSMVRASNSSKLSKLAGPLTKLRHGGGFLRVDARGDVDEHQGSHQVGRLRGQGDGGHAAEGHPDHPAGLGRQTPHDGGQVTPVAARRDRALGPSVGMPVPGQVHGQQGAAQSQGHRVPGVGVLRPPVHQHELGCPVSAPQSRLDTVRPGSTSTPTRRTSGGPG